MRQRTKSGRHSSGLRGFEAEILQSGAACLQPPQIDRKQPGTSHHGFLSGGSPGGSMETKDVGKFSKATPSGVPCLETPDRFDQERAHAAVAQPIDAAQGLSAAGAKFAWTTTDVAADLLAISEAVPIEGLPLQRGKGGLAQTLGHFARVVIILPRNLMVQLGDPALLGDE